MATDVRVDTDQLAGDAQDVEIASSGETVYAAWEDTRNGSADVYFSKSTDGGDTWLDTDIRLDTDLAGSASSVDVHIACDGNTVVVVWEDNRNGETDIYMQRSTDGGATWLASDVRIDQDNAGAAKSGDAQVAVNGSDVHIIFEDDRSGTRQVFYRGSADGGATFRDEAAVNFSGPGAADRPRLAVSGIYVYVVWHDNRNGLQDVYFNSSRDRGVTWGGADIRLDSDVAGAATSFDPAIDCDGPSVYIAWSDTRNGETDIYFARSVDGGTTFEADKRLDTDVAGASVSFRVQVACTPAGEVHVAWIDNRNPERDVYVNSSSDGGATFGTTDTRIDTDVAGAAESNWVRIVATGTNVYATWQDSRDGELDVRFNYSNDKGATWQPVDTRTDTTAAGASASVKPKIGHNGDTVFVVWADERSGDGNIHCNSCQTR